MSSNSMNQLKLEKDCFWRKVFDGIGGEAAKVLLAGFAPNQGEAKRLQN